MDVSIVIPCYNEAGTVAQLTQQVLAIADAQPELALEVIVVNDGSTDGTRTELSKLRHPACTTLTHPQNLGKGAALRTGVALARGRVVVFQDADLEYSPGDIPKLVLPILRGSADVVFGSRFTTRDARQVSGFWHVRGNQTLTQISNTFTGLRLTDICCGYKAISKELFPLLVLAEDGFGVEAELTAKLARLQPRVRVLEVPTQYTPRSRAAGKKIRWRDGWVALRCMIQYSGMQHRLWGAKAEAFQGNASPVPSLD
ncbi:MAG: hypothetical protein RJA70_209 [Pseudomonadota bacterium]